MKMGQVRQMTGSSNELLRKFTYNSQHEPLADADAAGQIQAFQENFVHGQSLSENGVKRVCSSKKSSFSARLRKPTMA